VIGLSDRAAHRKGSPDAAAEMYMVGVSISGGTALFWIALDRFNGKGRRVAIANGQIGSTVFVDSHSLRLDDSNALRCVQGPLSH
jgi:hypothetical protein